MDDLLTDFLTETNESLAEADLALVKLEQEPEDAGTLSLIFRLVHTIKGTCGFLGLPRLEHVAHAAENVLGRVRDGVLPVTPDLVTGVLAALDQIKAIVATLAATGTEPAGEDRQLIERLDSIAEGRASPAPQAAGRPATDADALAPVMSVAPPQEDNARSAAPPPVAVSVAVAAPPPSPPDSHPDGTSAEASLGAQTIRVGVDVLEGLMTLVSELVLTRNQLLQLARTQENAGFTGPLQRLSHITSDLQEGVMKTRMQPIGHAWNKLPRIVRDLARELNKKIDLVMLGAETELDRQVLELIKDPLTHMVRNSGDHGLEGTAERRAAGKAETGRITLNAFHEGGHIVIEIADDGRGLPVDRIKAKVISKGLATEAELAAMSDEAVQRFIFRPGFSTAAAVTAVSGRGVGMDVVKTNIERIGGTIELKSRPGEGTTFTIKIPLTLAIVAALIVQAGTERFAIPQISVVELVRAYESGTTAGSHSAKTDGQNVTSKVERINGTPVLRLRERLLPLVSLEDLLRLRDTPPPAAGAAQVERADPHDSSLTIIVAQVGASQLGLIVDRVFDTEEIVVKPVAPVLRHISMFSGNTILGDGSVIMILDPSGIARATGIAGSAEARANRTSAATPLKLQGGDATRTAMLLFKTGEHDIKAVPLSLVARLENIPADRIECAGGAPVTQYRGRLMRLVPMSGLLDTGRTHQAVLVFTDDDASPSHDRCMGLVVDEIVDVVDEQMNIELSGARDGILGTAIIAGRATDVIDTSFWLTQAKSDWFENSSRSGAGGSGRGARRRLLLVEDSDFFRQMIGPVLQVAGFEVEAVPNAARAIQLRDSGMMFDAIVSDIEMPDMNGLEFVQAMRASGAWKDLPIIALSGKVASHDIEAGREAGFTDYVAKFAKDSLLRSLNECLEQTRRPPSGPMLMVA